MSNKSLTIKSAILQSVYFAAFGSIMAFAVVILTDRGFSTTQIGLLLAIGGIITAILQPMIGTFADNSHNFSVKSIISGLSVLALVLLGVFLIIPNNLLLVSIVFALISITLSCVAPLVNALIFEYINAGIQINFGVTRGVGSLAFAGMTSLVGLVIAQFSASAIPVMSILFTILLFLSVRLFPKIDVQKMKHIAHEEDKQTFLQFVGKYKRFFPFLLGQVFIFVFHTMLFTYLLQVLLRVGGTQSDFGLSLSISAISELPVMLGFSFLAHRMKITKLLKIGAAFYVLRAILILSAGSVMMVNLIQLLQAFSFAVITPAVVYYVNSRMKDHDKVKGQALIAGANTVGSVVGNLLGGFLHDNFGVIFMLQIGAVFAVLGLVLYLYGAIDVSSGEVDIILD
ncbi:MAG: MFS transporter [Streptococcaceae bacterium]|jgi:PPP family 3-phenylpropionic acid transporter|nr:MFS transporter [Streptococcaceae bacterium]